jgi:hypothetical protein
MWGRTGTLREHSTPAGDHAVFGIRGPFPTLARNSAVAPSQPAALVSPPEISERILAPADSGPRPALH